MPDTEPTIVIFRIFNKANGGDVIALFPCEPGDTVNPGMCQSFMHDGQHGPATIALIEGPTRPATPEEYADLKRELESTPYEYVLDVRKRTPHDAADQRRAKLRR